MKEKVMGIDYDNENDILFAFLDDEYYKDYEYSEIINGSVHIDLDKNNVPIGVELSDASKNFKTKKLYLKNILSGTIYISISEKQIELSINLLITLHNKPLSLNPIDLVEENISNLPNIETTMAIA